MNNGMSELKAHPLAELFPPMPTADFSTLKASIGTKGQKLPVVLFEDMILDGRHRYRACRELGIDPVYEKYDGTDPFGHVVALNTGRRDLTSSQRATVAVKLLPELEKEAKDRSLANLLRGNIAPDSPKLDQRDKRKAAEAAGALVGVGRQYVYEAKLVLNEDPELFEQVHTGLLDLSDALREIKRRHHKAKIRNPAPVTDGPFDLILADPPWQYDFSETGAREIENHYPTSTVDQIVAHKPNAAEDCVLFLWATAPKLAEAFEVIQAWRFTYKTHAVWDKVKIGMGYWFRGQHEILLVATCGNFNAPPESARVSSIFRAPRGAHSVKPVCVQEWIERAFPQASKLEMYARSQRPGWAMWGNEITA